MKKAELVFIPTPGVGHLTSTLELAKLLVDRDDRLSITVLLMKMPSETNIGKYTDSSLAASGLPNRIRFTELPSMQMDSDVHPGKVFTSFVESHKPHVREAVSKLIQSSGDSLQLVGFVLDMFCTVMIDIANEFEVPSYIFFTSGAACLGLMFYVQKLHDEENVDITEFKDSGSVLAVPSLVNPFPASSLPGVFLTKDFLAVILDRARRFRHTKGIIANTFLQLESHAINTMLSDAAIPPVYALGPILHLKRNTQDLQSDESNKYDEIMQWLDYQPLASVVFLCFGSTGSFDKDQVKEIACGLEQNGYRFLWSLRKPPSKAPFMELPSTYENPNEILPEGFMDRTSAIGKIIGWAPQTDVLAHPAIGGFVSHCGWNSTLESIWFGVPIAAWPLGAEQQFNAFQMVIELGMAEEIKIDHRSDSGTLVGAEVIGKGIKNLMEMDIEKKKKVKEMGEQSRKALMEGGSSYSSLGRLIEEMISNMS